MIEKSILITGGAGYIGSHTVVELLNDNYNCVIVDNFSNSFPESIERQEKICGKNITYYNVDILDKNALDEVFTKHNFDAVVHFAGLKAVGESCSKPLKYYHNNVTGTIMLLECMENHKVNKLIFSSSSTVYGEPQYLPLDEKHPVGGCTNPYGNTKLVIEYILQDAVKARPELNVVCLRYFNPVGAHSSGLIGEDPQDIPNNLMPFITQVAIGRREFLNVFGDDYNTVDGTGVRDYIHVVDLALGHLAALNYMPEKQVGFKAYNLGTGTGYSVLQVIKAMEKASGKTISYKVADRRDGDIASNFADPKLAETELKWKASRGIDDMCKDAWHFQSSNPMGYRVPESKK